MRSRTLGAVCATCAVAVPAGAEAQAPLPAVPSPGQSTVAGEPPANIADVQDVRPLKRFLRLEARRRSLKGERLSMPERDRLGAELRTFTPQRLRAATDDVTVQSLGSITRFAAAGGESWGCGAGRGRGGL